MSALTGADCEPEQLYRLADRALYEAKHGGRDQVAAHDASRERSADLLGLCPWARADAEPAAPRRRP